MGKTTVYSTVGACQVAVYARKCIAGNCTRQYDGCEDSLFRSTSSVACGYEVGWEFVESVLCSKQTFSGFRKVVQARYARFSSPVDFMAVNTFIKWWFCWASAMNIDFRERCFSCGNDIRLLAADGTKLGITLKQASVVPIETSEEEQCHSTTLRRFDRTLITNTIGKENRKCINNSVQLLCDHVLEKINGNNEELPSVTYSIANRN